MVRHATSAPLQALLWGPDVWRGVSYSMPTPVRKNAPPIPVFVSSFLRTSDRRADRPLGGRPPRPLWGPPFPDRWRGRVCVQAVHFPQKNHEKNDLCPLEIHHFSSFLIIFH